MDASSHMLEGSLSTDDASIAELHVFPDGDLAGNFWDTQSTAGLWVEIAGLDNRTWPVVWQSKAEPATVARGRLSARPTGPRYAPAPQVATTREQQSGHALSVMMSRSTQHAMEPTLPF